MSDVFPAFLVGVFPHTDLFICTEIFPTMKCTLVYFEDLMLAFLFGKDGDTILLFVLLLRCDRKLRS